MICKNCGQPLKPNQTFCGNCGSPVSADFNQSSGGGYGSDPGYGSFEPSFGMQQFPKKKSKKLLIGIIAGVLVVAIATFGVIAAVTGLFNPKLSIREMEKKKVHELLSTTNQMALLSESSKQNSADIGFEFGPALNEFFSSSADLSWLKNAEIDIATKTEGSTEQAQIRAVLNGTELTTASYVIDRGANKLFYGLDGLSDSLCQMDMAYMNVLSSGAISALDAQKTSALLEKYIDMALDSLGEAQSANGSFTANGVTENCTVYTTVVKEKETYAIAKNVLNSVLDDAEAQEYLQLILAPYVAGYSNGSGSADYFSAFTDNIKKEIENLTEMEANAADIPRLKIEEYVSDNDIHGIKLTVYNGSDGSSASELFFGAAHNGNNFGVELIAPNGDTYFRGNGSKNGSSVSGNFVIQGGGTEFVNIKLDNFELLTGQGKIEITPTYDAWKGMTNNSMLATVLSNATFELENSGSSSVLEAKLNGQSAVKVTIKPGTGNVNIDMNKPIKSAETWSQSVDTNALISKLRAAGVPESLLSNLIPSSSSSGYSRY